MLALLAMLACGTPEEAPMPPKDPQVTPISGAELASALKQPADRPRVVNFWATWCAPCVQELPHLRDWAARQDNVELVLVNVDLFTLRKAKVEPFLKEHELGPFTNYQLNDKDPAIALRDEVPEFEQIVPFTLVIPASGGTDRKAITGLVEMGELEKTIAGL